MNSPFHSLHLQATPIVLPNAWDAGSARAIAAAGAQAIATTSAGVAWSLGYRDGDVLPLQEHLAAVRRIRRVVDIPLSVDIEGGYADDAATVGDNVARFMEAGAVGINIQDGSGEPAALCRKIEAARKAAESAALPLYINVRTDVYARKLAPPGEYVAEVLRRARDYREAGADGIFALGASEPEEIRAIAGGTPLLLNVVAWPGLAPAAQLAALGVRRISAGSWLPQTMWAHTSVMARAFLADGRSEPLLAHAASYAEVNASFGV
ncbi:isocitrate lyase/PEP mutase family protein [Massilia endophytica]|uniref:isocitrate lyase/PEP mutase family protein n=1 Tax=Massilia endophytica TaxID=2899220 RepID=UPI001E5A0AE5|nr:isocitrate lyase/phosphoenolpyruvate mutase family protein [Massilia endophytica]UGQ45737.1 isocitrate lyase/phosphoenolpyruvate mutase family protein [Massilia endophytica]